MDSAVGGLGVRCGESAMRCERGGGANKNSGFCGLVANGWGCGWAWWEMGGWRVVGWPRGTVGGRDGEMSGGGGEGVR